MLFVTLAGLLGVVVVCDRLTCLLLLLLFFFFSDPINFLLRYVLG
jgi:hypothetical protein